MPKLKADQSYRIPSQDGEIIIRPPTDAPWIYVVYKDFGDGPRTVEMGSDGLERWEVSMPKHPFGPDRLGLEATLWVKRVTESELNELLRGASKA